jgi:hypothetical protein
MRLFVIYLGSTFGLFLLIGQVAAVPNLAKLSTFVVATIIAFATGYHLKTRRYPINLETPRPSTAEITSGRNWLMISAVYFVVYGSCLLRAYGATSPSNLVHAILSPGAAYVAKFQVYEAQQASGEVNTPLQILTLLGGIYTVLVPFAMVYWKSVSLFVRTFTIIGVCVYVSFYLYIGTLKGLGDLLAFAVMGYLVLRYGAWRGRHPRRSTRSRMRFFGILVAFLTFAIYMSYSQSQRATIFGTSALVPPNPVVAALTGRQIAIGVTAALSYPTEGYLGLAYNLDTPFKWTKGLGGSPALDSYWVQYLGGQSSFESSYPARTQALTRWPALLKWATIYPWLASDISFPGTVLFMGLVGWWFARFWYEAAFLRSRLALLMFCELGLLLVYVPANNQIGGSRPELIGFVSIALLYVVHRVASRSSRSRPPRPAQVAATRLGGKSSF